MKSEEPISFGQPILAERRYRRWWQFWKPHSWLVAKRAPTPMNDFETEFTSGPIPYSIEIPVPEGWHINKGT